MSIFESAVEHNITTGAFLGLTALAIIGLCIWGLTVMRRSLRLAFWFDGDAALMQQYDEQRITERMVRDARVSR